jgi:hypothetical protein
MTVFVQLEFDSFMVEELRGRWSLHRVAPRCGTTLVTTTQVLAACFDLFSHMV